MNSIRSLSFLTSCLFVLISTSLLCTTTSASTSLWGQKLQFKGTPCLWQLRPEVVIPTLNELTTCILVRRNVLPRWTGFVYKAPGNREVELGLGGSGEQLTVWLFGKEWHFHEKMKIREWYTICITWSGKAQRLQVYINGTRLEEVHLVPSHRQHLSQNGTLTLGVSHFSLNGEVETERDTDLLGDIGLFRMWGRERSAEKLAMLSCEDGDVVSWATDLQQRRYACPPVPDSSLQCAWPFYKIKMQTFIFDSVKAANCSVSHEELTRDWLESIFPPGISLWRVSVSSISFSSEVFVNVDPAANVDVVQADMTALLGLTFNSNLFNLTADPDTISIVPVEFSEAEFLPTVDPAVTTSETGPTESVPAQPTNMSTTGEPLDFNETSVEPDTFFRVNLTLNVTSNLPQPEETIANWVKDQLQINKTMMVLNLVIKYIDGRNMNQYTELMTSIAKPKQYYCTFHVQEFNINSVEETLTIIDASLTSKFVDSFITIETTEIAIKHIVPKNCLDDSLSTIYGKYIWPETFPQVNQTMGCSKPKRHKAYRLCKLDIETDSTSWTEPDMRECDPLVAISDLDNVTVTTGNAAEVVDVIQDLVNVQLGSSKELSPSDLDSVVKKLSEVVDISVIEPAVGAKIVTVVADILNSKTDVTAVANNVLHLTEKMGDNMDIQGASADLSAPSMAFSMINVDRDHFHGLTFSVSSISSTSHPKFFVNQSFVSEPLPETIATLSLPSALNNFFHPGMRNTTRVQFQFYATQELFQDPTNSTKSKLRLNSYIVSANINSSRVIDLSSKDRVVVTLGHQISKEPKDEVQCVFWDFQKNGGRGGWNKSGCETRSISPSQTSCLCDHLTHFALLLDVSRGSHSDTDSQILTVISYLGCGISAIFLGITLLTYLFFEKLRRDYPSKILINLSTALLGLTLLFLLDPWLSSFSNYSLCITTAATLHYFLLASFTWMGLEALHMYLALVKVFNTYIPSYILKLCAVGWGVPLVIVSLVVAIDKDAYGSIVPEDAAVVVQSTDPFCWVKKDVFFYVTVVAFILLILLCNISVFIVVLIQIRRRRVNKSTENCRSSLHDLRAVASLTVLLGLTWTMGLFSFGPARVALTYLFVITSTFQGFFVFLFHCLMKENVRKQWMIHLCLGRFRLNNYSDWSRSVTVGGHSNNNNLINSDSFASDNTSTIRSSTKSSPIHNPYQQGA